MQVVNNCISKIPFSPRSERRDPGFVPSLGESSFCWKVAEPPVRVSEVVGIRKRRFASHSCSDLRKEFNWGPPEHRVVPQPQVTDREPHDVHSGAVDPPMLLHIRRPLNTLLLKSLHNVLFYQK